jgi:hypothetical protein
MLLQELVRSPVEAAKKAGALFWPKAVELEES